MHKLKLQDSNTILSLINSLISANNGQLPIYLISQEQIKQILEGLITLIGVLLNPIPKEKLEAVSNI